MITTSQQEEFEFIYNSLYDEYKKHKVFRKEYCCIIGVSYRTLKRYIDSGSKNIAPFNLDEETGRYSWKLADVARHLVGRNFRYNQNKGATIVPVTP